MPEERESVRALDGFLDQVREYLMTMVGKRLEQFPEELRGYVLNAWSDIEARIERSREQLREVTEVQFGGVGLTGSSLKLKIRGFMLALSSGRDRRILRWMNIILGSLSAVLPLLEPVKQYKEALEEGLRQD